MARQYRGFNKWVATVVMAVIVVARESVCSAAARALLVMEPAEGQPDLFLSRKNGCSYAALFVLGASYMDVGENFAFDPFHQPADFLPYGMDYFGAPTGRYSNGRIIIDHISQGLGHGLLSPYSQGAGATFHHGVSFASAGSLMYDSPTHGDGHNISLSLFPLYVQVEEFRGFRQQAFSVYNTKTDAPSVLPTPEAFSKGVYIIEGGSNDFRRVSLDKFEATAILVLESIEQIIRALHIEGARTIIVMDVFPYACFPSYLRDAGDKDLNEDGCLSPLSKAIEHYSSRLEVMVANLNPKLEGANLVFFSLHDVFMSAIRNPSKFGLKYVHKACCGYGGGDYNYDYRVECGKNGIVDGELHKATACENRSEYMLWDDLHPTEAFAFHIAQAFLEGEYMKPPFYIKEMCGHDQ